MPPLDRYIDVPTENERDLADMQAVEGEDYISWDDFEKTLDTPPSENNNEAVRNRRRRSSKRHRP